jgi:hypothetical protein
MHGQNLQTAPNEALPRMSFSDQVWPFGTPTNQPTKMLLASAHVLGPRPVQSAVFQPMSRETISPMY